MKVHPTGQNHLFTRTLLHAMLVLALLSLGRVSTTWAAGAGQAKAGILPPQSHPYGKSYAEWSATWWQWFLEHPMEGHPANPDPNSGYDVRSGQTGKVWFLASAWPHPEITIPPGIALFIPLVNVECSSLESPESGFHGDTPAEQSECAQYWADHILEYPSVTLDGRPIAIDGSFRFTSPQFAFTAPTPWVFGSVGGAGTAVGDGYYVMVAPLSVGQHTIRITGTLHFEAGELGVDTPAFDQQTDLTWHITVDPAAK